MAITSSRRTATGSSSGRSTSARGTLAVAPPSFSRRSARAHSGGNDVGAAVKLLRRALALSPDDDPAVALRLDLSQTLFLSGEFVAAADLANETAARAAAAGDNAGELRGRLAAARIAVQVPHEDAAAEESSATLLALAEEGRGSCSLAPVTKAA